MADKKRLLEIFGRVNGLTPQSEQSANDPIGSTSWTETAISEFFDLIGQDQVKMLDLTSGISAGDWDRVKFKVVNGNTLYLEFSTPELAYMAFNKLSDEVTNPYEISSRFDMMPKTIMVQFTDSGISESALEYSHADNAQPEQDQYQIGDEQNK